LVSEEEVNSQREAKEKEIQAKREKEAPKPVEDDNQDLA
jgi:hypothetical protein